MRLLGNILWIITGGFATFLAWGLVGIIWCITIVGIPIGLQCFKAARLTLAPFGLDLVNTGGSISCLMNVLWMIFGGLLLAMIEAFIGLLLCITIIGIPFGTQHFKFARFALAPMGTRLVRVR